VSTICILKNISLFLNIEKLSYIPTILNFWINIHDFILFRGGRRHYIILKNVKFFLKNWKLIVSLPWHLTRNRGGACHNFNRVVLLSVSEFSNNGVIKAQTKQCIFSWVTEGGDSPRPFLTARLRRVETNIIQTRF